MDNKQIKENELMDALSFTGCPKLPRAVDVSKTQGKIWILAIAKVTKVDGSWSYAILKNDFGKRPRITKIFGSVAAVAGIKSVHPYMWLDMSLVPKFKNEDEKTKFLMEAYCLNNEDRIGSLSAEDRDRLLYSYCMAKQLSEQDK